MLLLCASGLPFLSSHMYTHMHTAPGGGPLVYQALVRRLLPFLPLRGPFNTRSRARAGFTYDWWGPLTALSPEEVAEVEAVEAEVSAVPPTG